MSIEFLKGLPHHARNIARIDPLVNSSVNVSARCSFSRTPSPFRSLCRGPSSLSLAKAGVDIDARDRYGGNRAR